MIVPRIAFWAVNAPVRGMYWVNERYQVPVRVREALFNPEGSAGLGIRVAVLRSRDSWHMVVHHASPTGRGQAAPPAPGPPA